MTFFISRSYHFLIFYIISGVRILLLWLNNNSLTYSKGTTHRNNFYFMISIIRVPSTKSDSVTGDFRIGKFSYFLFSFTDILVIFFFLEFYYISVSYYYYFCYVFVFTYENTFSKCFSSAVTAG